MLHVLSHAHTWHGHFIHCELTGDAGKWNGKRAYASVQLPIWGSHYSVFDSAHPGSCWGGVLCFISEQNWQDNEFSPFLLVTIRFQRCRCFLAKSSKLNLRRRVAGVFCTVTRSGGSRLFCRCQKTPSDQSRNVTPAYLRIILIIPIYEKKTHNNLKDLRFLLSADYLTVSRAALPVTQKMQLSHLAELCELTFH